MVLDVGAENGSTGGFILGMTGSGILPIHLSWFSKVRRAFWIGLPASRDGVVLDRGCVNTVTMSGIICLR